MSEAPAHPKDRVRCTRCNSDKFHVFVDQTPESAIEYVCSECKNHQELMIE
jgi:DNA-directed RNA polymerase subunit RPC12/RpoP